MCDVAGAVGVTKECHSSICSVCVPASYERVVLGPGFVTVLCVHHGLPLLTALCVSTHAGVRVLCLCCVCLQGFFQATWAGIGAGLGGLLGGLLMERTGGQGLFFATAAMVAAGGVAGAIAANLPTFTQQTAVGVKEL